MASSQERIRQIQEEIARRAGRPEDKGESNPWLVFFLAEERFALPLTAIREISRVRPITALPGLPTCILGAAGLRGQVVPVIDLRRFLDMPEALPTAESRLIVIHHDAVDAALFVDRVEDIAAVLPSAIAPPAGETAGQPGCLQGLLQEGDRVTRMLDPAGLLEAIRHGK